MTTAAAFAVVAGIFTATSDRGPAGARVGGVIAAMGLGLVGGVLLAGVTSLSLRLGARLLGEPRITRLAKLRDRLRRDAPDRSDVLALHVFVVAAVVGLAILAAGVKLALGRLRSVQDPSLAEALGSAAAVAIAAGLVVIAALAWKPLGALFSWIDARKPLPLPASSSARGILWGGLPLVALGGGAYAATQGPLGPFAIPFACIAAIGLARVLRATRSRFGAPWGGTRVAAVGAVVALAGATLADRVVASWSGASAAVDASALGQAMLRGARALSDFDRDGRAALFGGGDCAPFDASRRPGAFDAPRNGVDEDCNGVDADAALAMPTGPRMGTGHQIEGRKPDVVWFVVDAVRADHVGFLGYERETTPNLDKLAAESIVFSHALSQSSATMLSFPSFLTGIDPGRLTWRIERDRLQVGPNQPFISARLESLGYRTGFVAADYFRGRLPGLLEGWSWVHVSDKAQTKSSASAAAHAATFIAQSQEREEPFFLVVYMAGPHSPYVAHGAGYPSFGKKPMDLYDQEIVNADRHIGFVLDLLRADAARWKNTVVVFNSDHGEEFNEHGGTDHARTCHVESVRVPLVVRIPGESPAEVEGPVALLDLVPTLLELTGGAVRDEEIDGQSLLLALHEPQKIPADRPFFCSVVSQKATQGSFFQRAVRSGKWVGMQELRSGQAVTLYDAEADPGEQKPLAAKGDAAEVAQRLGAYLSQQLTSNLGEMPLGDEP